MLELVAKLLGLPLEPWCLLSPEVKSMCSLNMDHSMAQIAQQRRSRRRRRRMQLVNRKQEENFSMPDNQKCSRPVCFKLAHESAANTFRIVN